MLIPEEIQDVFKIVNDCKNQMTEHTIDDGKSDMDNPVCGCEILQRMKEHLIDKLLGFNRK